FAGGDRCRVTQAERSEGSLPLFDLIGPAPPLEALGNQAQVGYWLHELGDLDFILAQEVGQVQPELVLAFREGRPQLGDGPGITSNGKPKPLEIPKRNLVGLARTEIHFMQLIQKTQFRFRQDASGRRPDVVAEILNW